jgi:hypothetical protein
MIKEIFGSRFTYMNELRHPIEPPHQRIAEVLKQKLY